MARRASLKPRELTNHPTKKRWILNVPKDLSPTGSRQRLFFITRDDAREHADKLRGSEGTGKTVVEQEAIEAALAKLAPIGASLAQAVDFYVAHVEQEESSLTVEQAVEAWRSACERRKLADRTLRSYRQTMDALSAAHPGEQFLCNLTADNLAAILDRARGEVAWQLQFRNLRAFWRWSAKKGWCEKETFDRIDKRPTPVKAEPATLTPQECLALLRAAEEHYPDCAAAAAVAIFGGVRMAELQRLSWSNLKNGYLAVPAIAAKKNRRRALHLTEPLSLWLDAYRGEPGSICPRDWEQKWNAIRQHAGWKVSSRLLDDPAPEDAPMWPQNAIRHTAASARLALGHDPARVALELGHSQQMLFDHYVDAYAKQDAGFLFRIAPHGEMLPELRGVA